MYKYVKIWKLNFFKITILSLHSICSQSKKHPWILFIWYLTQHIRCYTFACYGNTIQWICLTRWFPFTDFIFQKSTEKNLGDLSQVIVGGHSTCPPYPQMLLPNIVDKAIRGCKILCADALSCWNHIFDKSCKGTKSSKKSDSGPCNIFVYFIDIKAPLNINGPNKVYFHMPHQTFPTNALDAGLVFMMCRFCRDQ